MVKKVETYKSGPFAFSLNYDREKLIGQLVKAKVLYNTIAEIPILPNLASRLEEDLIRKSIFGTAAIEGNPLSEEEVNKILSEEDVKGEIGRAQKQIQNLKEAYTIIKKIELSSEPLLLQEDRVKNLHKIITEDSEGKENLPGKYRNHPVKVGDEQHGGIYTPPKIFDDIKNLMSQFIDWINSPEVLEEDPAIRGALAHYHLALIHPFSDGNGRTARVVEAILLKSAGIKFVSHMLANFYYKNIDDYFWTLSRAQRSKDYNITTFIEFFVKGLILSLETIKSDIFSWIRKFTIKDYYIYLRKNKEISQRQLDLLTLLLEVCEKFTLKDLFEKERFAIVYRKVTERTARRDLKLLQGKKLLQIDKEGKFILNYEILG